MVVSSALMQIEAEHRGELQEVCWRCRMIYIEEISLVLNFKQLSNQCTKTARSARFYCSLALE